MNEWDVAMHKARAYFPEWDTAKHEAWARGRIECDRANKVNPDGSRDMSKVPVGGPTQGFQPAVRVSGIPHGTRFVEST